MFMEFEFITVFILVEKLFVFEWLSRDDKFGVDESRIKTKKLLSDK